MRYRAIRGFNYKNQRFELGDNVIDLPAREVKQLIKDQTIESGPGLIKEEEVKEFIKEIAEDTVEEEEGGDDVDG